jgi:hypothetical protein
MAIHKPLIDQLFLIATLGSQSKNGLMQTDPKPGRACLGLPAQAWRPGSGA